MKILVTGAAGFMGSHLVDSLVNGKEHEVYGIDDLSGGYKQNIHPDSHFKQLDLRSRTETEKYINEIKPELVYHLAADATEGRSQFTPISAAERNYLAFMYLIVPLIKNKVKRVVLTSSMSVYGSQEPPFSEDLPRNPDDIYGISKSAMEASIEVLAKVHNFEYVIIRPHNVYGPKQNLADPYRNVIGIFINCLLNSKNFFIYGDGEQKRAFTYIDDFNPYILKSGFLAECNKKIINIGPTEEYSINEVAKLILKVFFKDGNVPAHQKPQYVAMRPQEVKEAFCTNDVAKKLLGYKTTVTLEEGVKRMVVWAKTQGPQKFKYLDNLEIENEKMPKTWRDKLI